MNANTVKETAGIISDAESETERYLSDMTDGSDGFITVFNTLPFARNDVLTVEGLCKEPEGYPSQRYTDLCGRNVTVIGGVGISGFGNAVIKLGKTQKKSVGVFEYSGNTLETPQLRVVFDGNGFIDSLVLKSSGREVRNREGAPLNTFYIGEDVPEKYDNWDIDSDQCLKMQTAGELVSCEVVTDGAVVFVIRSEYRITAKTTLCQDVIFYADSARVDFHTVVDWNDIHRLLKVGFNCNINSSLIKNEIQFGNIERPTIINNCYEAAKYEVCNHRWSDISETRFGVAFLNDCKYGISANRSDVRLSLMRGGIRPDVTGDRGRHEFTYSILPHDGGFCAENVIYPAYMLNVPHITASGKPVKEFPIPAVVSAPNVICETVKPAEEIPGAYVLRLYESERNATECTVKLPENVKKCFRTNFLEDISEELPLSGGYVSLKFRAFEVVTLLITP